MITNGSDALRFLFRFYPIHSTFCFFFPWFRLVIMIFFKFLSVCSTIADIFPWNFYFLRRRNSAILLCFNLFMRHSEDSKCIHNFPWFCSKFTTLSAMFLCIFNIWIFSGNVSKTQNIFMIWNLTLSCRLHILIVGAADKVQLNFVKNHWSERLGKSCWNTSYTPICKMLVVSLDFFPFIILPALSRFVGWYVYNNANNQLRGKHI